MTLGVWCLLTLQHYEKKVMNLKTLYWNSSLFWKVTRELSQVHSLGVSLLHGQQGGGEEGSSKVFTRSFMRFNICLGLFITMCESVQFFVVKCFIVSFLYWNKMKTSCVLLSFSILIKIKEENMCLCVFFCR